MSIVSDAGRRPWLTVLVAVLLLDVALTFQNIWPTPAIWWTGGVSVEVGVLLLALAVLGGSRPIPGWLTAALAWLGVVLVLGRYAVVTAPALFGRDVNLYWDLRFVPDVAAMLVRPASWLMTVGALAAIVLVPYLLFRLLRWALRTVAESVRSPGARRVVAVTGVVMVGLFTLQRALQPTDEWQGYSDHRLWGTLDFPAPVTVTYANQLRILSRQLSGDAASQIGSGPNLEARLDALQGTDVFLFFVESYGAIAFDRPEFRDALAPNRRQLAADIAATGRQAVSAFVESPTFGGGSWLAHISLLTGIEVKDEDTNQVLLTQHRDSLVTTFSNQGYRTVALMPGLQRDWPEGSFYRFDEIYPERRLDYQGPQFGWWVVPDQFSLARLDELELRKTDRRPVFAFMAGVSTHTPFSPTAPYQPDWSTLLTRFPYPPAAIDDAYEHQPDWLNLSPAYIRAMQYVYASLGGYLRQPRARDVILIVIGDHQPPALVTGLGAPWDVPVHVISTRADVIASLKQSGFTAGLEPTRPVLGHMHALTPILLKALGSNPERVNPEPPNSELPNPNTNVNTNQRTGNPEVRTSNLR